MGMIYTGHNLIENFRQYRMYQTITISKYDQHGKPVFVKIFIKEDILDWSLTLNLSMNFTNEIINFFKTSFTLNFPVQKKLWFLKF